MKQKWQLPESLQSPDPIVHSLMTFCCDKNKITCTLFKRELMHKSFQEKSGAFIQQMMILLIIYYQTSTNIVGCHYAERNVVMFIKIIH